MRLFPKPLSYEPSKGQFTFDSGVKFASNAFASEREWWNETVSRAFGFEIGVGRAARSIVLREAAESEVGTDGYRLSITPKTITIAGHRAGVFYGLVSLVQMLPAAALRKILVSGVKWSIDCAEICDAPRFPWRGAMLDPCRHFWPKEDVLKFIDLLALQKMSSLHIHLCDDQGWRMEIKKYPRLTEVGGWRNETVIGRNTGKFDGLRHGGFYTQDDLREIVAYAAQRHINVVPEIEMPGHASAAVASYPELGNTGKPIQVAKQWGVFDDVYNVEDGTLKFLEDVLDEVLDVFPGPFIHVGGDECPKVQWKQSPRAQARMKEQGLKNEEELQSWFIRHFDRYLSSKGRRLIGWDEILEGGLAEKAAVMSWRGIQGGIEAARQRHDVVMAPGTHTYLDFYATGDTEAEPLAIGGYTPLHRVYQFEPVPAELNADEAKHILGAQGQLWSEYLTHWKLVERRAFPRLCALSEVLWIPAATKRSFDDFLVRLKIHLERLHMMDVAYHPLDGDPGISVAGRWIGNETLKLDLSRMTNSVGDWKLSVARTRGKGAVKVRNLRVLGPAESVLYEKAEATADGKFEVVIPIKDLADARSLQVLLTVESPTPDVEGEIWWKPKGSTSST
ncbi:MAG: beta-N-acetylhexosaminidase [Armatimonadetes bacterium]|nr:beta-N-acetylhexosaminidase [Armatimonadota bacterium]